MTPLPVVIDRPISGVVRLLAILLVLSTVALLTLGGLTTSFRAGMADPVWPTEPWFLVVNGKEYFHEEYTGFLLEHTHRLAGWTVGFVASALALAAWLSGPDKRSRLFALACLTATLATYGWFHGQMMAASRAATPTGGKNPDLTQFVFPLVSAVATLVSVVLLLFVATVHHLATNQKGKWVRAAATALLVAVMIQGLLGGFRVFLDQSVGMTRTLGIELSALHGMFAQLVFSLMVCVPILAAPRRDGDALSETSRLRLGWLALAIPLVVFVQLLWAVWVRHAPTPLMQRLHILTAFLVLGLAVWLAVRVKADPNAGRVLRQALPHLLFMLAVQILLGVEAWMGKFAAAGEFGSLPPEQRPVTVMSGALRTLHQLIGTAILASSVLIAFRVWRRPVEIKMGSEIEPTRGVVSSTPVAA